MINDNNQFIVVHRPLLHSKVTPSGKIYSREVLENFVSDWKSSNSSMLVTMHDPSVDQDIKHAYITDLTRVTSVVVDMYVDDEGLVVHHKILDTPYGNVVIDFIKNDVVFSILPKIIGKIDDSQNVYDAKLYGLIIKA